MQHKNLGTPRHICFPTVQLEERNEKRFQVSTFYTFWVGKRRAFFEQRKQTKKSLEIMQSATAQDKDRCRASVHSPLGTVQSIALLMEHRGFEVHG